MSAATQERQSDFTTVTELPGIGATPETLSMLFTRYAVAAELGEGKDVLEVACGPGIGLGYLLKHARSLTAGDYDPRIVAQAQSQYEGRLRILELDAMSLPLADQSYDLVILLEALYFVPAPEKFFAEAKRVLRPGGKLFLATPNPQYKSFNPAPFTSKYYTAAEFTDVLGKHGFVVETQVGFPEGKRGMKSKVFGLLRKIAVGLNLIPKTMGGKELIKKLIYGKLEPFPLELDESTGERHQFVSTAPGLDLAEFKVLYCIATLAAPDKAAVTI